MKQCALLLILSTFFVTSSCEAHTKIFNHTPYQIKIVVSGLFPARPPYLVPAGETFHMLTGILTCAIITHVKVWVLDGNKDDFAEQPNIDKKVYLDRCFKEIHVIATPNELGEYAYTISTSHN